MISGGLNSLKGGLPSGGLSSRNGGITIVELGQRHAGIPNWSVSGTEIKSSQFPLGLFTGNSMISRTITLAARATPIKTVAVRYRLHLRGVWSGQNCWVSGDGGNNKIFQSKFSGTDQYKDIEFQAPFGLTTIKLTFGCDTAGVKSIQGWTVTDVGVHSSTCPLKYVKNVQTGECTYVGDSLFAGLIKLQGTSFLKTGNDVPAWAKSMQQCVNSASHQQVMVVDKTPATSGAQTASNIVEGPGVASTGGQGQGLTQGTTGGQGQGLNVILLLIGANANYSSFQTTGTPGRLTYFNGYPVFGQFSGNNLVSTQVTTLPSTQSVAMRVRLYLIGNWQNVPFTFSSGDNKVLSIPLSGQNTLRDIELHFPAESQKPLTLSMGIDTKGDDTTAQNQAGAPAWALSDVAIALSPTQAGEVPNVKTGEAATPKLSFFTTLLSSSPTKSFPGYQSQPIWLSKVVKGQYSPEYDIISVRGVPKEIPASSSQIGTPISAYAPGVTAKDVAGKITTTLHLIGTNFDHSMFKAPSTAGVTMVGGYPVFGTFQGTNVVSTDLKALPTTQSGAVRVRLHLIGTWAKVPFGFTVNGANVLNTQLTGTNTFQDIELNFPLTAGQPASLAMGIPQATTPISPDQAQAYKWALSDVAITLSNAPAGQLYQPATGDTAKVPTSFFTALLNKVYNEQFPGAAIQPVWLNKVAFGQFSPQYDIIVINGNVIPISNEITGQTELGEDNNPFPPFNPFGPDWNPFSPNWNPFGPNWNPFGPNWNPFGPRGNVIPVTPSGAIVIIQEQPSAPFATLSHAAPTTADTAPAQTINLSTLLLPQLSLVGTKFDTSKFDVKGSPNAVGLTYIGGVPVFGTFSGPTQVSTKIDTLPTTQAVAVRLRLHLQGVWNAIPFTFSAGGKPVLTTPITGSNQPIDVEFQFPAKASQPITLTFGVAPEAAKGLSGVGLQWAISNLAAVPSNAPVGNIYNSLTGGHNAVPVSFFTALLNTLYPSGFPNQQAQPSWLQKVLVGVFSNKYDIIAVDGKPLQLPSAQDAADTSATNLAGLISTQIQLVGDNFKFPTFQSGSPMQVTQIGGVPVLGMFSPSNILTTTLTPLASTQSVAYRFTLHMSGPWVNQPFEVTANGMPVLSTVLTGTNQIQQIEVQFPYSSADQRPITLAMGITQPSAGLASAPSSEQAPVQWGISNVGIAFSNAQPGHIYNTATGGFNAIPNSFFTALLNSYYPGSFPQAETQPNWLQQVVNGLFSPLRDIIAINGQPLSFSTSSAPETANALNIPQLNAQPLAASQIPHLQTFLSQNPAILQLVGTSNFDIPSFSSSNTPLMASSINNIPVLSYQLPSSVLTTHVQTQPHTQAVAYRFTLYMVGEAKDAPFKITANGVPVLTTPLSGVNTQKEIEVQFAAKPSQTITLAFSFAPGKSDAGLTTTGITPFQWTISQVGIALSSSPVGTFYNLGSNANVPITTSYFTKLLNSYLLAQFPGYQTQPTWLQLVLNGNFPSQSNIIAINGQIVNAPTSTTGQQGTLGAGAPVSSMFPVILQLVGSGASTAPFTSANAPIAITYLSGMPVLGLFSPSSTISTTLFPTADTKATIYRLSLSVVGQPGSQPFTINANGAPVFTSSLPGGDKTYNIEAQFPTSGQPAIALTLGFGAPGKGDQQLAAPGGSSSAPDFKWAISNVGISFSTTPVGTILVASTGETPQLQSSYFTALLNHNLPGQFPGVSQQPIWLAPVANALFTKGTDFISIDGKMAPVSTPEQTRDRIGDFLTANPITFQLIGPKMSTAQFTTGDQTPLNVGSIGGVAVLGPFAASTPISTTVSTQPGTQAVVARFNLYITGPAANVPFTVKAAGVPVLTAPITGTDQMRQIEVQFPAQASSEIPITLSFSLPQTSAVSGKGEPTSLASAPFKYSIGDLALVLSSTPVGTIGQGDMTMPVQTSYLTPYINAYLLPSISQLSQVPTWLQYVSAGQFSPLKDIIAISGKTVPLGINLGGIPTTSFSVPSLTTTLGTYGTLQGMQTPTTFSAFLSKTPISLQLVGTKLDTSPFKCDNCELGTTKAFGIPVMSGLTPTSTLTTQITPVASTQSIVMRFTLHPMGQVTNVPFTVTAGGVPVLTVPLTTSSVPQQIELQFTLPTQAGAQQGTTPGQQPGQGLQAGQQPGQGMQAGQQPGQGMQAGQQPGQGLQAGQQPGQGLQAGQQPGQQGQAPLTLVFSFAPTTGAGAGAAPGAGTTSGVGAAPTGVSSSFSPDFKWGISGLAIVQSSTPAGTILNAISGGHMPLQHSYFTPMLNIYTSAQIPGSVHQPSWLPLTLSGAFSTPHNIIAVDGKVIPLETTTVPTSGLTGYALPFVQSTQTTLMLTGPNMNVGQWTLSSGAKPTVTFIGSIPTLGGISPSVTLGTTVNTLPTTQAAALRFNLYVSGQAQKAPFTVSAGGVPVLSVPITAKDEMKQIEVQFPAQASSTVPITLSFSLPSGGDTKGVSSAPFKFGISDVALSLSSTPVGTIFSSATGANIPLTSSYFTPLLNVYLKGQFPGYSTQPTWLNYVLNGQFTSKMDIIAIGGKPVSLPESVTSGLTPEQAAQSQKAQVLTISGSFPSLQAMQRPTNVLSTFFANAPTYLQLAGPTFSITPFSATGISGATTPLEIVKVSGFPTLGNLAPGHTLSTQIGVIPSTQAAAVRFTLHIIGQASQAPLTISAGGKPVLTVPISGINTFKNVEVQFTVPSQQGAQPGQGLQAGAQPGQGLQAGAQPGQGMQPVTFTITLAPSGGQAGPVDSSIPTFKWSISQLGVSLSPTPVGTIINTLTGGYKPVTSSYFTPLLGTIFQGQFPGVSQQPTWLQYVLNGQFTRPTDIIAIDGKLVNIPNIAVSPMQLQGSSPLSQFHGTTATFLQLVSSNASLPSWTSTSATPLTMTTVGGVPAASLQSPSDVLMTTLTPLQTTQSVAVRFTMFMVGPMQNVPFTVKANGAPVLSVPLTGKDQFRQIELQFPVSSAGAPTTAGAGVPTTAGAGAPTTIGAGVPTTGAGAPTSGAGAPTSGVGAPTSIGLTTTGAGAPTSGLGTTPITLTFSTGGAGQSAFCVMKTSSGASSFTDASLGTSAASDAGAASGADATSRLDASSIKDASAIKGVSSATDASSAKGATLTTGGRASDVAYSIVTAESEEAAIAAVKGADADSNAEYKVVPMEECNFKWSIGQMAVSYSNVPVGHIFNTATSAPTKLVSSYFTPLLSVYTPGQFVGYPQQQQPNWLTYVLNGQFTTPVDIIAINGQPINLDTRSIPALSSIALGRPVTSVLDKPVTNVFASFPILTSSLPTSPDNLRSAFLSLPQTILQLTGPKFDITPFSSSAPIQVVPVTGGLQAIGLFSPTTVLTQDLKPTEGAKSAALRFVLYTTGPLTSQPFTITANGAPVLSYVLTPVGTSLGTTTDSAPQGNNYNIEVQFPITTSQDQPKVTLALTFAGAPSVAGQGQQPTTGTTPFKWAIGQLALSFSTVPAGHIPHSVSGGYSPVLSSYFTPLLGIYLSGKFPGYSTKAQPTWLNYVMNGDFDNKYDIIAINGTVLPLGATTPGAMAPSVQAAPFHATTQTILQLVGTNIDTKPFTTTSGAPLSIAYLRQIPVLSHMPLGESLQTTLTPLATTQAIALRFQLFLTGEGQGDRSQTIPLTVTANGVNVLTAPISAAPQFQLVEAQFPYKYDESKPTVQLSITLGGAPISVGAGAGGAPTTAGAPTSGAGMPLKWTISQVATSFSNVPAGNIFNSATGGYNPVANSFFTPLLNIYYAGQFPGYSSQPVWTNYVLNGQFEPKFNIIAINGTVLNLGPTGVTSPITGSLSSLPALQNLAAPSGYPTGIQTVLQLVGANFDFPTYSSSDTKLSIMNVGNVPMLGNLQPTSVLTATFQTTPVTKAVALRFTLNVIGSANNVPLTVTANQVPVLTIPITGTDMSKNIEVQFPFSPTGDKKDGQLAIAISFAPTGADAKGDTTSSAPFKWAIGQLAASYSTVPAGHIPNYITGGYSPVASSFFTPMLQLYYAGAFPGTTTQPNWLNYVLQGQFEPKSDIIAINGTVLNLGNAFQPITTTLPISSFLGTTKTILELVGSNPSTINFGVTGVPLQITPVGSMPALGQLAPTSTVTYKMVPLASTQAGIVRFTLMVTGPADAQLKINAGGNNVLTAPITGNNIFQNIEAQFPLSVRPDQKSIPLTISLVPLTQQGVGSAPSKGAAPSYQWAISQLAITYSGVPAGHIPNIANLGTTPTGTGLGYSPVLNSYLTPALGIFYGGSFPGYPTSQQPTWLNYVLNGQFEPKYDIIAINGTILNLAGLASSTPAAIALGVTPSSMDATPFSSSSLDNLPQILNAQTDRPKAIAGTVTKLELVGSNPSLSSFSIPSSTLGTTPIGGILALGPFTTSQPLTYTLNLLPTTKSVTTRFNLYVMGTATNAPLSVTANGVNVLSIPMTGTDFNKNIELQFTMPYTDDKTSQVPLTISFASAPTQQGQGAEPATQDTQPFKWAIGQLSVTYSHVPAGHVPNVVTGGHSPVVNSYLTPMLQNLYGGKFPGYTAQPTWLPYVLQGQFNNVNDIIAINGVILNLGTPTQRAQQLQHTLGVPNFLANTKTILELVGTKPDPTNFNVQGAPVSAVPIGSIMALGNLPSTSSVTYNMMPLASTQAGIVRFTLLVNGQASNVPLTVTAGGSPVLTIPLSGQNFFQNIELQFPLSSTGMDDKNRGIPLTISFGTVPTSGDSSAPSSDSSPFKWAISQLALTYSNAPAGYIPNSVTGGYNPLANSYYTPALGIFYAGSFPGYSSDKQPTWVPYVLNGQFNNNMDIIAINGTVLNFGTTGSPLSNSLDNLPAMSSGSHFPQFASQMPTIIELTGPNFNLANFSSPTDTLSYMPLNSIPVLGGLSTPSVLQYTLSPLQSTKSAIVRFQLTTSGPVSNVPFTISTPGYNVLTIPMTGDNLSKNIEVQFPITPSSSGEFDQNKGIPLTISFAATPLQAATSPFKWGISQFAVSYSAVPAGYIPNTVTGGYSPVLNSYITPLLQNYYGGSFPGYGAGQQPTWLAYVLNGQFEPKSDIIAINGTILNFGNVHPTSGLGQVLQANNFGPLFTSQTKTVIELTGTKPSLVNFGVNQGTLGTTPIGSLTALGNLAPTATLTYMMSPLSTTNAGIVRFILMVNGQADNQPFYAALDGKNVLTVPISGKNMFQNVEIQFPLTASPSQKQYQLTFGFTDPSTSSDALSSAPFKWAISQLAVTYSSAPAGHILNGQKGGYTPVANSFYTPALGIFYAGQFPGYGADTQPKWIPYVLNGQFDNKMDIIAINGTLLNFGSTGSSPLSHSILNLPAMLSAKHIASPHTYLQLTGPKFDHSMFTSPTKFGVLRIGSVPVIGYFNPADTVQTMLSPTPSTKAINVRFNLYTLGDNIQNVPLTITAGGQPVLSHPISTTGHLQNIEVQFPYTAGTTDVGTQIPLAITFGSAPSTSQAGVPFQWALGQVAVSFSKVPAGHIPHSVTGGYSPVLSSYFTPLLQIHFGGSFPGYTKEQQPRWLNHVLNGQFNNNMDIIAINGTVLNFGIGHTRAKLQASQLAGSIYPMTKTVLELTGPKFGYGNFKCNNCDGKLGTTPLYSIPALGQLAPASTLSYTLTALPTTKSAIVRFTLMITGDAKETPLTLTANNVNVLTIPITGSNIFQNVEAQFPYTYSPSTTGNVLTIQLGSQDQRTGSSAPFKWAISQFAITYSGVPAGHIPSTSGLGYSPVASSYYTPMLGIFYAGAFPKYSTEQQPNWIPYVLNGQFNNNMDIIAINGTVLNFGTHATPLSNVLSHIGAILSTKAGAPFLTGTRTVLELVGLNFKYPSFSTNIGTPSIMYLSSSVPALGSFSPSTTLSYLLAPSSTTNAIIVRFNLHMMGTPSTNTPFTIALNGVNVLSTPITSTSPVQYVEAQFPYFGSSSGSGTDNQPTLTISFVPLGSSASPTSTSSFKWAISQFAVTYTNAPAGYLPNSVTGSYMPVANSFQSPMLQIFYAGQYPGYSAEQQPNWIRYILNGQFSNDRDIIAINGTILNFGSPSTGLQYFTLPQGNNNAMTSSRTTPITLVLDLVGSNPMYNVGKWSINRGSLNTIQLGAFPALGYISPGYILSRQYLNLNPHKSIALRFQVNVASPTGFTFWVRSNGVPVMQTQLPAGTYYRVIEAQYPNSENNVVITLGASPAYGSSSSNAGGFALSNFGFYANPCGVKNFFNTQLQACQLAGNSVFYALSYVNYPKGFQWLPTQPSWHLNLQRGDIGKPYEMYFIRTQPLNKYLSGIQTYALVAPSSINRPQYTALGGNQITIELVNLKSSPTQWIYTTPSGSSSAPLTQHGGYNVLGSFNIGANYILTRTFTNLPQHATVIVRYRLMGTGNWNNYEHSVLMNGIQIFTRNITMNNDFRDIELQFVHTQPKLELKFMVTSQGAPVDNNAGWKLHSFVMHMNPCSVQNVFNVLLNTCTKAGNTAVYQLYRTDHYGQFYNLGLNLMYLPKFQSETGLKDDGREIYHIWTGEQKPVQSKFTGLTILELAGTNFNMGNFQIRGTRQAAYSSQLYGYKLMGPFESTAIIRRVWTSLPTHSTITVRFRLYLVGSWVDQNTIVQSAGQTVFKYVLGETDTYQDLEITFDHTSPTLEITILSTPSTDRGARAGIQFGISDMAVHLNPCGQRSYFDIGTDKCAKSSGYSTVYGLVQTNALGNFPVKSATPTWFNILSNKAGIDDKAHEVYSFLKGTKLQVIKGVRGKPQFIDLDLLTRLKKQIKSTPVKTDADTQALAFLSGRTSTKIVGDYNNGTISSYGTGFNNLFGTSFAESKVDQFEFSFGEIEGWACVGLIEADNSELLDLNGDYRDKSLVICSDNMLNLNTKFMVKIDVAKKVVKFQDQFYKQGKSLPFKNVNNLHYTVQFHDKGTVYFGKQINYYNKPMKKSSLRRMRN